LSLLSDVEEILAALGSPPAAARAYLEVEDSDSPSRVEGRIDLIRSTRVPRLFDYQGELAEEILNLTRDSGSGLVSLPTGAGKTRTAMYAMLSSLRERPQGRWLWLAPTVELLDQAVATVSSMWDTWPAIPDMSIEMRSPSGGDASIWLNTPQAINSVQGSLPSVDVVVFDEAHQLGAPTYAEAVQRVRGPHTSVIGLSATPGRTAQGETEGLVSFFDGRLLTSSVLGTRPVEELQERGVLAKLVFKKIGKDPGKWTTEERPRVIARLAEKLVGDGRQSLVFTSSVAEAIALSLHLRESGIPADFVEGRLPDHERTRRLKRFADGVTRVMFNQRLLATGYDCPAVSDVVLGSRVGSAILFEQIVGRAARGPMTGGSRVARVWQFDDHLGIHGLPQSYYRYRDFDWVT
jgi:superfamily II DNA or RNA helicase